MTTPGRAFLDAVADLERQYGIGDSTDPTAATLPEWRRLVVDGRWVTSPVEGGDAELPTGRTFLFPSSAIEPSVWMQTTTYGNDVFDRYHRRERHTITLHYRGYQLRRLAMQMLTMAEWFDSGGDFDPDTD